MEANDEILSMKKEMKIMREELAATKHELAGMKAKMEKMKEDLDSEHSSSVRLAKGYDKLKKKVHYLLNMSSSMEE